MCELRKLCAVWAAFSAPEIEAVGVLSLRTHADLRLDELDVLVTPCPHVLVHADRLTNHRGERRLRVQAQHLLRLLEHGVVVARDSVVECHQPQAERTDQQRVDRQNSLRRLCE